MPRVDSALTIATVTLAAVLALARPMAVAFAGAVVVAALLLRGAPRVRRPVVVLSVVVGAVAAWRAHRLIALDVGASARAVAALPHPERCEVIGRVASMPRMRGVISADVIVESNECEARGPPLVGLTARIHDLGDSITRDARVRVIVQLAPSRRSNNPDLGDSRPIYARRGHSLSGTAITVEVLEEGRGLSALLDRIRAHLRRGIATSFAPDTAPIARAMVLGEEDLSDADDEAFRRSGLTHLLAVSGSHVALVVGGLVACLRLLLLRLTYLARRVEVGRVAAAIGVPLACLYEQLSGDSGSARRATLMAIVVLLVRASGRRVDLPRTLGLSILAALAIDPLAPFDLSFALSIAATIGLVALGPLIDRLLTRLRPAALRKAIAATVAASVACAPLIAGISASIPVAGVVANLAAVPVGELAALPLCNVAALSGAVLPPSASRIVGNAASGSLVLLRGVARVTSAPASSVVSVPPPTAMQLAVIIAAVIVMFLRPRARPSVALAGAAVLLLLEVAQVRASRPPGVLRITVLDVGQGDSTLIDLPEGGAILIDAGGEVGSSFDPGRAIVAPVLAARRRRALDLVVLTHPHPDHFLGLSSALARVTPRLLWQHDAPASLISLLRARGAAVRAPLCGAHMLSGATIEVLHPCPAADADRAANDNSIVLRVSFRGRSAILVGDAEREAEEILLRRPESLRADFLKVGHHGSRTSSSAAFLAAVAPSVATISCGVRNRFGHPHVATLANLQATGARVLRTDLVGAIRFTTDGERTEVVTGVEGW